MIPVSLIWIFSHPERAESFNQEENCFIRTDGKIEFIFLQASQCIPMLRCVVLLPPSRLPPRAAKKSPESLYRWVLKATAVSVFARFDKVSDLGGLVLQFAQQDTIGFTVAVDKCRYGLITVRLVMKFEVTRLRIRSGKEQLTPRISLIDGPKF